MLSVKNINGLSVGVIYDDVNNSCLCFRNKEEFIECLIEIGINVNELEEYFIKEEIIDSFNFIGLNTDGIF